MIIAVNFPIQAIGKKKPEKNQGFNGIRTRDLLVAGAILLAMFVSYIVISRTVQFFMYLCSIKEHRKTVPCRRCRGMNVHVSGIRVKLSPFLRSSLEVSLIICQNKSPHEKIAWRYPETLKDKCYIHRGGVGNAQGTPQVKRCLIWIVLKISFTSQGKAKVDGCSVRP